MSSAPFTPARADVIDDELELPVEVVAERLGLPAAMLIRRIEAGDIPARRFDDEHGAHYTVRIADLGMSSRVVMPPVAAPANGTSAPGPEPHISPPHDEADMHTTSDIHSVDIPDITQPGEPEAELRGAVATAVEDITEAVPPPPAKATVELAPIERESEGPRAELAAMALDPRELVAGLLDRWERTLEQRIYAEQRQRFEAELTNRQAKVKQLQLELEAARAEHAAALAEKDRMLADKMLELVEQQREAQDLRYRSRRGWFFRR